MTAARSPSPADAADAAPVQSWTNDPWHFVALTVLALVLLTAGWLLLRRRMAQS